MARLFFALRGARRERRITLREVAALLGRAVAVGVCSGYYLKAEELSKDAGALPPPMKPRHWRASPQPAALGPRFAARPRERPVAAAEARRGMGCGSLRQAATGSSMPAIAGTADPCYVRRQSWLPRKPGVEQLCARMAIRGAAGFGSSESSPV